MANTNNIVFRSNKENPDEYKYLVFVNPDEVKLGVPNYVLKFPFNGAITKISAFCLSPGVDVTKIKIEKMSAIDFQNNKSTWSNIFVTSFDIPIGLTSYERNDIFKDVVVNKDDYFRVNIVSGVGIKELNLHLEIKLK